jgi:hypothetical protein
MDVHKIQSQQVNIKKKMQKHPNHKKINPPSPRGMDFIRSRSRLILDYWLRSLNNVIIIM